MPAPLKSELKKYTVLLIVRTPIPCDQNLHGIYSLTVGLERKTAGDFDKSTNFDLHNE